jgi:hypothetical protein
MDLFVPEDYGFRAMPERFNDYWGNGDKWYKVTEKSESAFWFTVCRRVNPNGGDDRWRFHSAVATNDATGLETTSDHVVYLGCITSRKFAESLLSHIMGTTKNEGVAIHGQRRLDAPFLEYS